MKFVDTSTQVIFDSGLDYILINLTAKIEDSSDGFSSTLTLRDQIQVPKHTHFIENQMLIATKTLDDLMDNHPYFLLKKCESPIEVEFYVHALYSIQSLKPQIKVGPYRVDFAIPDNKYYIELDGHDFHSSKEQRAYDAKRDRYLLSNGWKVIRFTGSEINADPSSCVDEIKTILKGAKTSGS